MVEIEELGAGECRERKCMTKTEAGCEAMRLWE